MKNLVLITRTDRQQRLADMLRSLPTVRGFTFTLVEGHGPQATRDSSVSAHDAVVGYTPQVRADILLDDADVEPLLVALSLADNGLRGRGVYWVTPVERHGQF